MIEMQEATQYYVPALAKHFSVCCSNALVTFKVVMSAYLATNLLRISRTWHKFIFLTPNNAKLVTVTVWMMIYKLTYQKYLQFVKFNPVKIWITYTSDAHIFYSYYSANGIHKQIVSLNIKRKLFCHIIIIFCII